MSLKHMQNYMNLLQNYKCECRDLSPVLLFSLIYMFVSNFCCLISTNDKNHTYILRHKKERRLAEWMLAVL